MMVVTIIGSCSNKSKMLEAKRFFQSLGFEVNCPCDEERSKFPLLVKMTSWIDAILSADLVVAIPKTYDLDADAVDGSTYQLMFGESTSYEIAIAAHFEKKVVFF